MVFIPPATLALLNQNYAPGERHAAMLKISLPLIGNGMSPQEVFAILRDKFSDPDKTDKEIWDIVDSAVKKHPTPSVPSLTRITAKDLKQNFTPQKKPSEVARSFLDGDELETEIQPLDPSEIFKIWEEEDMLNVVCKFIQSEGKARPIGPGKVLKRDEWIEYFRVHGPPSSDAGAWIRFNPCSETGSGHEGAITDGDIKAFKFVLIESDSLPLRTQLNLYQKFRLPIAAIISSGGASYHAWVRVKASDHSEYREISEKLLEILKPFGFDQANKNESRLSRLPGAKRKIGAVGDGMQHLLMVNPSADPFKVSDLEVFEESLKPLPFKLKALPEIAKEAEQRYEDLISNPTKHYVKTGFDYLDLKLGGLKNGGLYVVGARTNVGKSVFAMNVISHALDQDKKVVLFTMEMDSGEIIDMLYSMRCYIDRNKFNTGQFAENDPHKIIAAADKLTKKHLLVCDAADPRIEDIRRCCRRLKSENRIDFLVIDYLQLASGGKEKENREQQVAAISRGLRAIAQENKIPVLALSQLNDEGKVRESRSIGHEASCMMILEEKDSPDVRFLTITKGRSVPKISMTLDFDGPHAKLKNRSQFP